MFTDLSGLQGALIGLALLGFFVARQFSARPVASLWTILPPVALAYYGMQGIAQLDSMGWLLLGLNLSLGVALGFVRGMTIRVWTNDLGAALMRGTAVTLVLWLVTFAVRAGLSFGEHQLGLGGTVPSTAEIFLPAAATVAVQGLVVYLRSLDQQPAIA